MIKRKPERIKLSSINQNEYSKDHERNKERHDSSNSIKSITRLRITNLHKDLTNSELYQLFSEVGKLKRCGIHWDDLGRSLCSADIEYYDPEDSKKAISEYNNAEVEGQSMVIEYASENKGEKRDLTERLKRIRLKQKDK